MTKHSAVVLGYGCPRSGTSYLKILLKNGIGFMSDKIREADRVHPCRTKYGLAYTAQLLRDQKLLLVRIVRNPIDVFESFYAWRLNPDRPTQSDERIYKFIRNESDNTQHQLTGEKIIWPITLEKIKYEDLAHKAGQEEFVNRLCTYIPYPEKNRKKLCAYLYETFGKVSCRWGKLAAGMKEQLVSDSKRKEIYKELREVFDREGYEL